MTERELLGGETPFVAASDAPFVFGSEHRPLSVEIDGKPATRAVNLYICALMWNQSLKMSEEKLRCSHADLMRGFIAGANTDMRALGVGPLISIDEVRAYAEALKGGEND